MIGHTLRKRGGKDLGTRKKRKKRKKNKKKKKKKNSRTQPCEEETFPRNRLAVKKRRALDPTRPARKRLAVKHLHASDLQGRDSA